MAYANRGPIVMQGRVFMAEREFNGALLEGMDWVGNSENASLELKQKFEDIKDHFTGLGLSIANPPVETDADFMIAALDHRMENWAMATYGVWNGGEAAGSVSGESITLYNGRYCSLAKPNVSNVVVAGATADTDYVVDSAAHGMLRVLTSSSAVPDGTPLTTTVAYDYAANNGVVQGFVRNSRFYTVEVHGINVAQGNAPGILRIHQIQLSMAKKLDFIDKKAMRLELTGKLLQDSTIAMPSGADDDFSQFFTWTRG